MVDNDSTETLEVQVWAVLPEFNQVLVRTLDDGRQFVINRKTPGVRLEDLRENQHLTCTVLRRLPKVVLAEALA